ncbi:hypothetical protein [Kineosporia babensis]|uniref:TrbL/VirB6 plasmid conjugal transfer protein n=1 Tax=Kineosporia babensis TaxID=499548 RepID=A0A9X1NMI7_9ACTN|nr:hypothetical protein [Kineosporia babensis]MCD5316898.1 hypothetical protein [Kineosporia babensis]
MPDFVMQDLFGFFWKGFAGPLNVVLLWVKDLILRVPAVTTQQPVMDLAARSLQMVQAGYVVLAMIAAVLALGHGGLSGTFSAKDVLQRMVLGFVAAHESTWIVRQFTDVTNALITGLAPSGLETLGDLGVSEISVDDVLPSHLILSTVLFALILFLLLWLVVSWLVRFAGLSIAVGLGPLALACHAVPWLDPIAQAWWRDVSAVMLTVLGQALTMHLGILLFMDPGPQGTDLAAFSGTDNLINLLLTLCLLIMVLRVPAVVARALPAGGFGGGGRGFSVLGAVVRVGLARQVTAAGVALMARKLNPGRLRGLDGLDGVGLLRRIPGGRRFGLRARSVPDGARAGSRLPSRGRSGRRSLTGRSATFGIAAPAQSAVKESRTARTASSGRRSGAPNAGGRQERGEATGQGAQNPPGSGRRRRRNPETAEERAQRLAAQQVRRRAGQRARATKRRNRLRNAEIGRRIEADKRLAKRGKSRPPLDSPSLQAWRAGAQDPAGSRGEGRSTGGARAGNRKPASPRSRPSGPWSGLIPPFSRRRRKNDKPDS